MVNKWLRSIQSNFQDILFPRHCVLCGDTGCDGIDLCADCQDDLPRLGVACVSCGTPLTGEPVFGVCGTCLQVPPAFHETRAALRYRQPVDYLIHQFKFGGDRQLSQLLGRLILCAVGEDCHPDSLIPVPLHPRRMRSRGFNQSRLLANVLARELGIPVDDRSTRRVRDTATQSELSAERRRINLRDAFECGISLRGQHVAIVDDVMTTGHTANELARVLVAAGARRVDVWVCARAG